MPGKKIKKELTKKKNDKAVSNPASDLQKAAFVLSIIGVFIPFLAIIAIVFGAITKKEKPNNWRAKWAIGLGIAGVVTSNIVILMVMSYIVTVAANMVLSSFGAI